MSRTVILGAGESGTGAALLAKMKGLDVFVSDNGTIAPQTKLELEQHGIPFEENKHSEKLILNADEVIKSPGIPETAPIVAALRQKGTPVISEIEFAGRYSNATKIGITGSNGKTTTSMWIYHILKQVGKDVILVGNIGKSYARAITEHDPEVAVIELSSFQLDGMYDFVCNIAIITNITPDHLDRYNNDFQKYTDSKLRIKQNMKQGCTVIFNNDDPILRHRIYTDIIPPKLNMLPFSFSRSTVAWVRQNVLRFRMHGKRFGVPVNSLHPKGKHNVYNAMCVGLACLAMRLPSKEIMEGLLTFKNVEHRMEWTGRINGVTYINDSKATNIDSTWYALDSMTEPVVWIAGGTDKGNDYSRLFDLVKTKVKALICLGADNSKLIETFGALVPVVKDTHSMAEAVKTAAEIAGSNETVLLSPACASFDLFNNYEHRGQLFKQCVKEL